MLVILVWRCIGMIGIAQVIKTANNMHLPHKRDALRPLHRAVVGDVPAPGRRKPDFLFPRSIPGDVKVYIGAGGCERHKVLDTTMASLQYAEVADMEGSGIFRYLLCTQILKRYVFENQRGICAFLQPVLLDPFFCSDDAEMGFAGQIGFHTIHNPGCVARHTP